MIELRCTHRELITNLYAVKKAYLPGIVGRAGNPDSHSHVATRPTVAQLRKALNLLNEPQTQPGHKRGVGLYFGEVTQVEKVEAALSLGIWKNDFPKKAVHKRIASSDSQIGPGCFRNRVFINRNR